MPKPKFNPLRVNVGFIIHEAPGYSRTFDFDLPEFELAEDLQVTALKGTAQFTRTQQGLLAEVTMLALHPAECARCLNQFGQSLKTSFTELYVFDRSMKSDETELVVPEEGYIDLRPVLREYLLLDDPINPLCRPDCRGLCVVCGANRNETDCGHQQSSASDFPQVDDPRIDE